jgi:transcriptional regulator with XRE-family HTH domain
MTGHKHVHPIQAAREAKGWSRLRLADEAKLSLRTLDRIEDHGYQPQPSTLQLLSLVLDVPVEELRTEAKAA